MAKVTRLSFEQGSGLERRRLHLREISPDLDAPLETVGQDLRAARQRKGEDLASVSRTLKIRKDHLDAIEESKFDALPGRAYALGFVRSYADYLGLDSSHCVERYKAEIAGLCEQNEKEISFNPEVERKLPQGTVVLAIALLIGVAYGGYYLQQSADRMLGEEEAEMSVLEPAAPEPASTAPAEVAAPGVPVPPAGEDTASAAENGVPPDGEEATASIPEAAAPSPTTVVAALPPGRAYGTRNVDSRITLRVHSPTRVLVQAADETVFINRTLSPGDLYQAPDVVGMTVSTADSGAVEVILDGVSLGFLGAKGSIAEALSLNPQDIVDRSQQSTG